MGLLSLFFRWWDSGNKGNLKLAFPTMEMLELCKHINVKYFSLCNFFLFFNNVKKLQSLTMGTPCWICRGCGAGSYLHISAAAQRSSCQVKRPSASICMKQGIWRRVSHWIPMLGLEGGLFMEIQRQLLFPHLTTWYLVRCLFKLVSYCIFQMPNSSSHPPCFSSFIFYPPSQFQSSCFIKS